MTQQEKKEACAQEIGESLQKYGFQLGVQPPIPVLVPVEEEKPKVVTP